MDLALHFPCAYSLIKQGFRSANHLSIRDSPSPSFGHSLSRADRRSWSLEKASSSSSIGRSKKGSVCCKNPSDEHTAASSPSKSKQEEIISLFRRIQASISKGESQGADEKNSSASSGNESLSKAILDVLEKPRKKTDGVRKEPPKRQVARPPSRFVKRSPIRPSASGPTGKLPITKSSRALEETEKDEKPPLIVETMKLAELKEVAKNRGLKRILKVKQE